MTLAIGGYDWPPAGPAVVVGGAVDVEAAVGRVFEA